MGAPEHELTGQIRGDEELRLRVTVFQSRRPAPAGPRNKPVQMSVELAFDVMVILKTAVRPGIANASDLVKVGDAAAR
jgi:hypothetical protein